MTHFSLVRLVQWGLYHHQLTVRHANQAEPVLQVLSLAPRAKLGNFHSSQAHQHVLHVTKLLENTQVALSQAHARRVV